MDFPKDYSSYRNTVTDTGGKYNLPNTEQCNRVAQADNIANRLVDKLKKPDRRKYYCKVAYMLSEAQIESNLELALSKGRNPQRYFTWLCERDIKEKER